MSSTVKHMAAAVVEGVEVENDPGKVDYRWIINLCFGENEKGRRDKKQAVMDERLVAISPTEIKVAALSAGRWVNYPGAHVMLYLSEAGSPAPPRRE